MASGGVRVGQGRPVGSTSKPKLPPTVKTAMTDALLEIVLDIEVSPLEIMLRGMKFHYDESRTALFKSKTEPDELTAAAHLRAAKAEMHDAMEYAVQAAPYVHAKLSSVTLKGDANSPLEVALGLADKEALRKLVRGE